MKLFVPCIPLLMFYAVAAAQPAADGDLKRILDFMSVVSGRWNNKAQIEAGSTLHDLLEVYVQQVEVPALGNTPVLYVEHCINSTVVTLNVMLVKVDDDDKDVIRLITYEFADPTNYKPNEFKVEDLRNLTRDQLKHDPDCVDNLVRVSRGIYSGICVLCRSMVDGINPGYAVTLMCDRAIDAIPTSVRAKASVVPYKFRLIRPKFPLINPPANYTSPCDKKLWNSSNFTDE